MNRLEFLKEIKQSLVETVQYACAPIMEDKIDKWNRSFDVLSQLQWWHVTNQVSESNKIEEKYIDSQTIILVHENNKLHVFNGLCPSCEHLLTVFQKDSKCKCMYCEKEYSFASNEENCLQEYPLKSCEDGYYVGLRKRKTV
ncbi:hypothetical protein [Rummeliibacillus pycnus]|uniref:hypothetical protein n=1 Tax=Rummeliibacillus pycnus TaxID=101070 RepID=UPI0037C857DE